MYPPRQRFCDQQLHGLKHFLADTYNLESFFYDICLL